MEISVPSRAPSKATTNRPNVSFTRCPKQAFITISFSSFAVSTTTSFAVGTGHFSLICSFIRSMSVPKQEEFTRTPYSCFKSVSKSAIFPTAELESEAIKEAILFLKSPTSCATAKGTGISSPSHLGISPSLFTPGSTFIFSFSVSTSKSTIRHVSPFATNNAPGAAKFSMNRSSSRHISFPLTMSYTLYFLSSGIIERFS